MVCTSLTITESTLPTVTYVTGTASFTKNDVEFPSCTVPISDIPANTKVQLSYVLEVTGANAKFNITLSYRENNILKEITLTDALQNIGSIQYHMTLTDNYVVGTYGNISISITNVRPQ